MEALTQPCPAGAKALELPWQAGIGSVWGTLVLFVIHHSVNTMPYLCISTQSIIKALNVKKRSLINSDIMH